MISFHDHGPLGRRQFLRIGGLSLGGLTLPWLHAAGAASSETIRDRSVIFLFLHGGPSQVETFDPKMSAPEGVRSATGEIKTALPGVTFASSYPKLAKLADRLTVVRSFVPGDANHDIKPVMGKDSFGANLGCVLSHVAGPNHAVTGMPTNVALFPRAVDPRAQQGNFNFGKFDATGSFGASCAPFMPGSGGNLQRDMELRLPRERLADRRALLKAFDQVKKLAEADGVEASREKALGVLLKGVGEAFDLSKEDSKTVARYDTEPLVRPENIDKKWRNYNNYVDNAKTLGKLLLLARRLCERGCGFVTVTTNFVWDMHADVNNAGCEEGMGYMGVPLDHALSAFIEDTQARGLDEKILLVACGEMGRTPRLNKNGGRDHWGGLAPLLLYGGGLKMGQVLGQSSRDGGEPQSEPVTIENLIATIADELLDLGQVRLMSSLPNELVRTLTSGTPIPGLS